MIAKIRHCEALGGVSFSSRSVDVIPDMLISCCLIWFSEYI